MADKKELSQEAQYVCAKNKCTEKRCMECTEYTKEDTLTGVKFLSYGTFFPVLLLKFFWQLWLPVRFSGVWAGGNLRIFSLFVHQVL